MNGQPPFFSGGPPPPHSQQQPQYQGNPQQPSYPPQQPGFGYGQPPTYGGMPPPPSGVPPTSSFSGAVGGQASADAARRPQFFNTAGGVPQPTVSMSGPPTFQLTPPDASINAVPPFGAQVPSNRGGPGGMVMPPPPIPGGPPPMDQQPPAAPPPYAGQMYGAPPPQSMVGMPDAFGGGGGGAAAAAAGMVGLGHGYGAGPYGAGPGGSGQVLGPPAHGALPVPGGLHPGHPGGPMGSSAPGGPGAPTHHHPQLPPGPGLAEHSNAPVSQGPPLPTLAETDMTIKCDPKFLRTTVGKVLNSQAAAATSKVPLGIICSPMKGDVGVSNDAVDVVDFGDAGIVRCKRCRTYINPFASWTDNGRKWRCNICGMVNETPPSYFCHLDSAGRRTDREEKAELSKCSVEFVAPNDYMVRAPQPPVYFFVIDVSSHSASSGMLTSACSAIRQSLDSLPGKPRTQIGFITFDTAIHFYSLKASLNAPQMLVVSDTTDITVPLPEDLLVDLVESRAVVEALLDALPGMFSTSSAVQTCTGPALQAAKKVISHVGGKLCLFQSSLPTLGEGALKNRENPKFIGTDKEHNLLNAEDPWYKENAVDFSRLQVAVDTYMFSGQYTDLATLSVLSKYTAGTAHYYPLFSLAKDGKRFEADLIHGLTRPTAFEAVMRVRCSRGLRLSAYYGNYFIRGNDLLALPNCTSDSTFAIDLQYEDQWLTSEVVTVQAALLYTSSAGERRIRVHTMVIPVTQSSQELLYSMDMDSAVNLMSKQSVELATRVGFQQARDHVQQTVSVLWRHATNPRIGHGGGAGGYGSYGQPSQQPGGEIEAPPSVQFMPVYAMALQKNAVLRGGQDVRLDERAYCQQRLLNMNIEDSKVFIYPRLFRIDDMPGDAGLASDNFDDPTPTAGPFRTRLPGTCLSLTHKSLLDSGVSNGMFLLENGVEMLFRVGRACNPSLVQALFGVPVLEGIDLSTLSIQSDSCDFAFRLNAIIVALRAERGRYMPLRVIKESDGSAEAYFARYLVEDRAFMMEDYDAYFARLVNGK